MKITNTNLIKIIRETLQQDLRGRLDPKPGHMANLEAEDPHKHYMMWAGTNGEHPFTADVVATYALEQGLESTSLEIKEIVKQLNFGLSGVEDVSREMERQKNI